MTPPDTPSTSPSGSGPHTRPMLAVAADRLPSDQQNWAFELKWDGVRVLASVTSEGVRLTGRSGADMTVAYPELAGLRDAVAGLDVVLDGEVVVLGSDGRPNFQALAPRMHVRSADKAHQLSRSAPVTFIAFDLVMIDGRPTLELPYSQRRELLEGLGLAGERWQVAPALVGRGTDVLAASQHMRLEGVVAKRLNSPYRPGRRSADWLKIKNLRAQEVVIGGFTEGEGARAATLGALLLGLPAPDGHGLTYAGSVGTGFDDRALADLSMQLKALETAESPFIGTVDPRQARTARWVRPVLVGEVAFGDWTEDGRMRHPTWRGLRPDKSPDDVVRES